MEIKRFFLDKSALDGEKVIVDGQTFVHLTVVLRAKVGYKVIACFNDGAEYDCSVVSIDKSKAVLHVDNVRDVDKRSHSVVLFAGLLKNQKLDYVVQKAVELGVDEVFPFFSSRTVETKFNLDRASTIALESAQQCGSAFLTKVHNPISFEDVLGSFKHFDTALIAYEDEKSQNLKTTLPKGKDICLVVGPEGGFEPNEVALAKEAGAQSVSLGKRILRADTASIVFSALTLFNLGEHDYEQ